MEVEIEYSNNGKILEECIINILNQKSNKGEIDDW